jgi:hypothetical protein
MVLLDDPEQQVIEGWSDCRSELEPLYDVELMQKGGHLEGFLLRSQSHVDRLLTQLEALFERTLGRQNTDQPLFWAMGDGNHSLATAKARWNEVKQELAASGEPEARIMTHPERWALCEIVNLHSPGLRFEPIHRAVFTARPAELARALRADPDATEVQTIAEAELKALLAGPDGQNKAGFFDGRELLAIEYRTGVGLPPALVDRLFDQFRTVDGSATIDFIHGWDETKQLIAGGAVGFFLPVLARDRLFTYVAENGPLPKKSFSMGESREKRYYMEARKIVR